MALFGAESQLFRKLIAFVCCDLGRFGVEAEERGRFDSEATPLPVREIRLPSQRRALSRRRRGLALASRGASVAPSSAAVDEARYGRWISL